MTREEIEVRKEIRQLLANAGITADSVKVMVKEELERIMMKGVQQAINETNMEKMFRDVIEKRVTSVRSQEIQKAILAMVMDSITISVKEKP